MTELLYLPDNDHETQFEADVVETGEDYVVLDRTHFYPAGGGQPADEGTLLWAGGKTDVVDVQKKDGQVHHYVDGEMPDEGTTVHGKVDEARRDAHRRMHTAQHVLSRVVLDEYGANVAGNQIHADRSRIDFKPAEFSDEDVQRIEEKTNEIIANGLPVTKEEWSRERVETVMDDDRVNLDLIPEHVDPLRVVVIGEFDVCPCGGTHVNRLDEIGTVMIVDRVSKGADVERLTFTLR